MATWAIEEGLQFYLRGYMGLLALVSTRVYINRIPQEATLPCVTLHRVSTPRVHSHDSSGMTGTAYPRFQIDAWATTYSVAKAITDQLRAALNGYKGTITSGANSVTVQSSLVDDERYDPDLNAGLERISSDFIIWHLE
jgi:hypothetical protein